jgi:hypothetical protein
LWSQLDCFAARKFQQRCALKMEKSKKKNPQASLGFFFGLFHLFVTTTGFEPARLAAPPPQDGESTNFSMWPVDAGFPAFVTRLGFEPRTPSLKVMCSTS